MLIGINNGGPWQKNKWNDFAKFKPFLYKIFLFENTSQTGGLNYILVFTLHLEMA